MTEPRELEIRVTEWPRTNEYRWTLFDAHPDYQSDQVEGVLVPWAMGEAPSSRKAVRDALTTAVSRFGAGGVSVAGWTVQMDLALLASLALVFFDDERLSEYVAGAVGSDTDEQPEETNDE